MSLFHLKSKIQKGLIRAWSTCPWCIMIHITQYSCVFLQVTEDVHRLIADYYDFVCRGQVSVKGKGQMLTYFLGGRKQGSRPCHTQQHPEKSERRSSVFAQGSVCTRLSPAPTVTSYSAMRTPSPSVAKPTTSTTTRYLPSVPPAMV